MAVPLAVLPVADFVRRSYHNPAYDRGSPTDAHSGASYGHSGAAHPYANAAHPDHLYGRRARIVVLL